MLESNWVIIFIYISTFIVVVPLLFGISKFRTFDSALKVLFFYLLAATATEIIGMYLSWMNVNNLFIYYIFSFIEFSLFSFIFFSILRINHQKNLLGIIICAFAILTLIDLAWVSGYEHMNALARNTECVSMIILALLSFRSLISTATHQYPLKLFSFWFSTAVLIYFSGSFFVFLFGNYMIEKSPDTYFAIYSIHSIFNIIFNILLTIAITKKPIVT